MYVNDIMKHIMNEYGLSTIQIIGRMKLNPQTGYTRMKKTNPTVGCAVDMLASVGYKLIAVPEDVMLPEECYLVTYKPGENGWLHGPNGYTPAAERIDVKRRKVGRPSHLFKTYPEIVVPDPADDEVFHDEDDPITFDEEPEDMGVKL